MSFGIVYDSQGVLRITQVVIVVGRLLMQSRFLDHGVDRGSADGPHRDATLAHLRVLVLMRLVLVRGNFRSEGIRVLLKNLRYRLSPDVLVLTVVFAVGAVAV